MVIFGICHLVLAILIDAPEGISSTGQSAGRYPCMKYYCRAGPDGFAHLQLLESRKRFYTGLAMSRIWNRFEQACEQLNRFSLFFTSQPPRVQKGGHAHPRILSQCPRNFCASIHEFQRVSVNALSDSKRKRSKTVILLGAGQRQTKGWWPA